MVPGCRGRAQKTKMKSAVGFPVPGCRVFHDAWEYWMETKLKGKKSMFTMSTCLQLALSLFPGRDLAWFNSIALQVSQEYEGHAWAGGMPAPEQSCMLLEDKNVPWLEYNLLMLWPWGTFPTFLDSYTEEPLIQASCRLWTRSCWLYQHLPWPCMITLCSILPYMGGTHEEGL